MTPEEIRAEAERVWEEAYHSYIQCFQDEKLPDAFPPLDILLAAKRRWENAKLDEAAVVADAYPFSAREVAEQIRALKE